MLKCILKTIKATIVDAIVALLIIVILVGAVSFFCGARISEAVSIASKMSTKIDEASTEKKATEITDQGLTHYPAYGTQYATIEIPEIGVNLPVYYGDTLDILKKGVGHSSGSYFPGEGGSIIYMGHNAKKTFRKFSDLKLGDKITVKADYGTYTYKIYDMKLIKETDLDALPIQKDKEILMIYTCYPFNNIGYATQRYVVYAELDK